jgi:hypothetical protein
MDEIEISGDAGSPLIPKPKIIPAAQPEAEEKQPLKRPAEDLLEASNAKKQAINSNTEDEIMVIDGDEDDVISL